MSQYIKNGIPIQLGLKVKSNRIPDGLENVPTITTDTAWVVTGWYVENDAETYVHCLAIHDGDEHEQLAIFPDYSTGETDLYSLSEEAVDWITENGSCFFGQPVCLNSTSRHFEEYQKAEFAILSVEGNELNEFNDSSKGDCNWLWHNEKDWVLVGLNANKPLSKADSESILFPDGVVSNEFNNLSVIAAYTTLLAVQFSEIQAIK
ncbi:hypothetical protein [Vibrio sp. R78045]|uniref:hypothetical protein n=1 Tax=Vibrio sp. R78045 TaxID=3093868 RepID=UPI0036F35FED